MASDRDVLLRQVEHLTDMSAFENALQGPDDTCHWYPTNRKYRKSGMSPPQVGDIAWCGHVKTRLGAGRAAALSAPQCANCLRIRELNGAR